MCQGCWQEMGGPKIVNEKTTRAAKLVKCLYEYSCVGGNLHIVTDAWNLEDCNLRSGLKACAANCYNDSPEQLAIEMELGELFLTMTEDERASALALEAGYFRPQHHVIAATAAS